MIASTILAMLLVSFTDTSSVKVTGSIESNSAVYVKDDAIGSLASPGWGSNNYLRLDLTSTHIDAGLQAEYYPMPLRGYRNELKGFGLPMGYIRYRTNSFDILGGNFYEQYGSGLLLRSWEDRQLGINNSILGVRAAFNSRDGIVKASAMAGLPRYCRGLSSTFLTGADIGLDLSKVIGASAVSLLVEGSFLHRYERDVPDMLQLLAKDKFGIPQNVNSYSARASLSAGGFFARFEYIWKGRDFHTDKLYRQSDGYSLKSGNAQLLETGWTRGAFSANMSLRRLNNMQHLMYRTHEAVTVNNTLNYIPALCQQQTYMLANLYPYVPIADGEAGGQADIYYNFKRKTVLGGRYGMKLHIGGSMSYALPQALSNWEYSRLAYRDINVDIEKRFNRSFKMIFFVSIQESSPTHGDRFATVAQNVFVVDFLYNINSTCSIRGEMQYLYSREMQKDWMAGLLEISFAPSWSIYASDMYNHGSTGIHYYDFGASLSRGAFRLAAGYGRHREGMVCSGGVCRYQPAFTGGSLQLTYRF